MGFLLNSVTRVQLGVMVLAVSAASFLVASSNAHAAADPTTGIDYKTDLADPVLNAAKPAIIAGVGILVVLAAVSLAKRLWGKTSGAR